MSKIHWTPQYHNGAMHADVRCLFFTGWDAPTKMQPGVIDKTGFIVKLYDYELLFYICDCNYPLNSCHS